MFVFQGIRFGHSQAHESPDEAAGDATRPRSRESCDDRTGDCQSEAGNNHCASERDGAEPALHWAESELRRAPSLLGLESLLTLRAPLVDASARGEIELTQKLIQNQARRLSRYVCDHCGFKARQFYWRCPACGGWETYPPRRGEEFDQSL